METVLVELLELNEKFRNLMVDIVLDHMDKTSRLYTKFITEIEMEKLYQKWGVK